jgi:ethanolamine transporter EutH
MEEICKVITQALIFGLVLGAAFGMLISIFISDILTKPKKKKEEQEEADGHRLDRSA